VQAEARLCVQAAVGVGDVRPTCNLGAVRPSGLNGRPRCLTEFEQSDIVINMAAFDHLAHLRLALDVLGETSSVEEATDRMAAALRQKAADAGHPEKYHHSVTVFWMRMLGRLTDKDLPLAYYSRERLFSDAARRQWVEPDLRSLDEARPRDPSRHA